MIKIDIREWNNWMKDRFKDKDLITFEELLADYEELIFDNERLQETINDMEQDIQDNYKKISVAEQVE